MKKILLIIAAYIAVDVLTYKIFHRALNDAVDKLDDNTKAL